MKSSFTLYRSNTKNPILVSENSNSHLLQRCRDNWYKRREIKYPPKRKWCEKVRLKISDRYQMDSEFLFIHIPKTGGISFKFNVIYSPNWNKKVAVYHKFNYPSKNNRELDIFSEKKKMFTLMREPTKTVVSAYYHFNHLINLGFDDFATQFSNMQTKFLMGYDVCSSYRVTMKDVNMIKNLIDEKKLTIGIHRTDKMLNIYDLLSIDSDRVDEYVLNKKVNVKYKLKDIPQDKLKRIEEKNIFDNILFSYVLNET